jgi:hypothetical protein
MVREKQYTEAVDEHCLKWQHPSPSTYPMQQDEGGVIRVDETRVMLLSEGIALDNPSPKFTKALLLFP